MYMKAFLLTYRSFATPEQLLCKLIERYHVPAREEQNRTKIQLRVCNTVKVRHTQASASAGSAKMNGSSLSRLATVLDRE